MHGITICDPLSVICHCWQCMVNSCLMVLNGLSASLLLSPYQQLLIIASLTLVRVASSHAAHVASTSLCSVIDLGMHKSSIMLMYSSVIRDVLLGVTFK